MQTITKELLSKLKNATDIEAFFKQNENKFLNKKPADYLNEMLAAKDLSVAHVANMSGIGEYTYKIFSGNRNPSRDTIISISAGMKLTLEETQFLLRISKFAPLDSREQRDSIIIYGLHNKLSVFEIDDILHSHNLLTLN